MPQPSQSGSTQARIMDLEHAVHEAIATIEFLHGCLTNPAFEYAYPEMTDAALVELRALVSERQYCAHSRIADGCPACEERVAWAKRRAALEASA